MDDGLIRLSTYDMNKGFRSTFSPISVEEEGKVIINAARLYQTMKVMPEDEICFDIDENQNCTISCGKASFSMFSMRGEDYPNLPELTSDKGFKISAEMLRKVIGKVSHSVAEQDSRPMLCGAFFKITSSGVDVVSSDSFTLSQCRINSQVESIGAYPEVNYSFILHQWRSYAAVPGISWHPDGRSSSASGRCAPNHIPCWDPLRICLPWRRRTGR